MGKNRNSLLNLPDLTRYLQDKLGKFYLPGFFSSKGDGITRTNFYRIVPTLARDPIVASVEITFSRDDHTPLKIQASLDLTVLNATTLNELTYGKPELIQLIYDLKEFKRRDTHTDIPFP